MTADTSKSLDLHAHPEVGASPAASKDAPTAEVVKAAMARVLDPGEDMPVNDPWPFNVLLDAYVGLRADGLALAAHVATLTAKLEAERARATKAEEMAFVPGRWRCAKCALVLTSTNLHVSDGGMTANNEPHTCPNECGPMWRVSERDERKEAQRSFIDLHEKSTRETARADAAEKEAKALREARDETNRRHSSLMSRAAGALEKMQLYATEYPKDSHVLEAKEVAQMLRAEARATLAQPAADGGDNG